METSMNRNEATLNSCHFSDQTLAPVLIVDDDRDVLFFVKLALENEGIDVLCADNGPQALDMLTANACRVMITDQHMPLMDGFELAQRARRIRPGITVFMETGHLYPGIHARARAVGIREVFGKPFDFHRLHAALEEALTNGMIKQPG